MTIDWRSQTWRKSTFSSADGDCTEVAFAGDLIGVRDSKLGDASPILEFTQKEWRAFIAGARAGEFDL